MKSVCKYLGYATAVLGLIGSFILAKNLGVTLTEGRYTVSLTRDWPMTIGLFISGLFGTAILTSLLLGISNILESLENLEESRAEVHEEDEAPEEILSGDFWKCPNCGNRNPSYTGTCSCGHSKP